MSIRLIARRVLANKRNIQVAVRKGSDHHGPNMPPFARLAPPKNKLPEEVELVWDDSVAPETCIDFDAPHVSTREVLSSFAAAFGFFFGLYTLVSFTDPVGKNPVALRATVIPHGGLKRELGHKNIADDEE